MTVIDVDGAGDLIVEVREESGYVDTAEGRQSEYKSARFRVSKGVLKQSSAVLLKMLVDPRWNEAAQDVVSLGEGTITATELWLRVLHKTKLPYDVELKEMWFLVQSIDYFQLDVTKFEAWFATWYEKKVNHTVDALVVRARELLYPTWRFNHAKGFAHWTKFLAYNATGHVTESNPTELYNYHLPPRLIQQLNAAKGRLRTVLHRGLFNPCEKLFDARCSCRKETLYDYQKHLYDIDVWPLETIFMKKPVREILGDLDDFSYKAPKSACSTCRQNYPKLVGDVVSSVEFYFDGLCLDCLDRSKAKTGDIDMDYWCHHTPRIDEWCNGCRFPHKQPTWYFSFNGRKEERDRLVKEKNFARR